MNTTYSTTSLEDTRQIASIIAKELRVNTLPRLILLNGELGGGKTTFTQFLAQELGVYDMITSPTFTIMRSYPIPSLNTSMYHLDIYRLHQSWELEELGLSSIIRDNNIIIVEWAENIPEFWKVFSYVTISFEVLSPEVRTITINTSLYV